MLARPPQQSIAGKQIVCHYNQINIFLVILSLFRLDATWIAGINCNYVPATSTWTVSLRAEQRPSKEEVCEQSRAKAVDNLIAKVHALFGAQVYTHAVYCDHYLPLLTDVHR